MIPNESFSPVDTISLLCIWKWLPGLCRAQTLQEGVPPTSDSKGWPGRPLAPLSPFPWEHLGHHLLQMGDSFTERLDV